MQKVVVIKTSRELRFMKKEQNSFNVVASRQQRNQERHFLFFLQNSLKIGFWESAVCVSDPV